MLRAEDDGARIVGGPRDTDIYRVKVYFVYAVAWKAHNPLPILTIHVDQDIKRSSPVSWLAGSGQVSVDGD